MQPIAPRQKAKGNDEKQTRMPRRTGTAFEKGFTTMSASCGASESLGRRVDRRGTRIADSGGSITIPTDGCCPQWPHLTRIDSLVRYQRHAARGPTPGKGVQQNSGLLNRPAHCASDGTCVRSEFPSNSSQPSWVLIAHRSRDGGRRRTSFVEPEQQK
jgi:hypothetical protein